jgi:hypothetical protein
MAEKRILPHQRDTDQGRECVVDDVRGDCENRKAEQDERQPLTSVPLHFPLITKDERF